MDKTSGEEFDNFLSRVEEVSTIIQGLSSGDNEVSERASRKADLLLNGISDEVELDEDKQEVKSDRTIINYTASKECGDQDTMSPEVFMKTVERDATERAKERKERKEIAEGMKNQGNKAFRAGDYNKALNYFNKAIEQVKDSSLLYTNRALTFINLGLYFRALSDCDTALKIYEKSFKAKLYKAQCLAMLSATDEAESIINDLIHDHPEQKDIIEEYKAKWVDCPNTQPLDA